MIWVALVLLVKLAGETLNVSMRIATAGLCIATLLVVGVYLLEEGYATLWN